MEVTFTENQLKTAQSCYNMFQKWKTKTESEKKTPAHYIKAVIDGYPNKKEVSPSLLKTRLNGIVRHCEINEELNPIAPAVIAKSEELIGKYKIILKNKND